MAGRSIFGGGRDDADDAEAVGGAPNEGVRIIDPDEAERVAEREDVAPRRGGDTPRYGDRPKGPPPGPKPALRFPLDGADDPADLDRPRAAPVPSSGQPEWAVADEEDDVDVPESTEAVPIVVGEEIEGFEAIELGGADDDTHAWSVEEDEAYGEIGDEEAGYEEAGDEEAGYEEADYAEAGYEEAGYDDPTGTGDVGASFEYVDADPGGDAVEGDDEGVLSFDPPSDEVALPHWTDPPTGQVPQVLVDDEADDERWASFAQGPRWRDQHEAWEGDPDLTGDLMDPEGGDDHSLGALDTSVRPTHEEFLTFDDLDVPAADAHTVANLGRGDADPTGGADGAAEGADDFDEGYDHDDGLGDVQGWEAEPPPSAGTADDPIVIGSAPSRARPVDPNARPRRPEGRRGGAPRPSGPRGEGPGARGERPGGTARRRPDGDPSVRQRRAPAGRAPDDVAAQGPGGRDVSQAVVVGLGIALVAIVSFMIHPLLVLALIEIIVVLAGIEYFTALRRKGDNPPALLGLTAIAALPLAAYARGEAAIPLILFLLVLFSVLWFVFGAGKGNEVRSIGSMLLAVLHVGMLGAFASLLLTIGPVGGALDVDQGRSLLLLAILASVGHDVGGFFLGRRFGTTPITPISPNKTAQGLVAGMASACLAVLVAVLVLGISELGFGQALVLGVITALVAPVGDLAESLVKRDLGVKDMGGILPGHGGILDRFDGLLFVLPAAYYVVRIFFLG